MRHLYRLVVGGSILALLFVGAVGIYPQRLKRSADRVVRASYELAKRQTPPTLDEIRQRLGPELKQPDPCTPFGCGYEVSIVANVIPFLSIHARAPGNW
jgi:hypothetical protein